MLLHNIRLLNQQLVKPDFCQPKELIEWMGAMQAQEYTMVKWAVGIRLKSGTLEKVEQALQKGDILRTHVMRPTWHLVVAEDIRWMLKLSADRNRTAYKSYAKGRELELPQSQFIQSRDLLERILCGNKSLTKQEIAEEFNQNGLYANDHRLTYFLAHAELDGLVCSGVDKGNKPTYALLEERIPPVRELTKDESLARLARNYFRSHAPATLQDFVWWSGLSVTEAKQAIHLIDSELIKEQYDKQPYFIHETSRMRRKVSDSLFLLPSYDEYLISYKKRTDVLALEHHSKAFTNYGIFYPVILHNGKVIGRWTKTSNKKDVKITHSYFEPDAQVTDSLLELARKQYDTFLLTPKK